MDDIFVWGEDRDSHNHRLRKLSIRETEKHKSETEQREMQDRSWSEISYIGHILTKDELKPDKKSESCTEDARTTG